MSYEQILITIAASSFSVGITFYIKDFLQKRSQYTKLKRKLENIAGKNAHVLYDGVKFKLSNFDIDGVILINQEKSIFIPTEKLLKTEMILPSDDYSLFNIY